MAADYEALAPPLAPSVDDAGTAVLPGAQQSHSRSPLRSLALALSLVVLGSAGAHFFKTGGGTIEVTGLKLPTENGQWITADLFRPRTATQQNPAPAVVVCPGFERSKETLDSYAIELARRGIVVITIDPYNQGASSSTMQRQSASVEGYGVIPMVESIYDTPNLNYIDKRRIGATGYSAGGNAVLQSAAHFGGRLSKRKGKKASPPPSEEAPEAAKPRPAAKLAAVFAGGYILTLTGEVLAPIRSNVGIDYAFRDEGAFRNARKNADMSHAPEALGLVNGVLPKEQAVTEVVSGRAYGDPANRTLRIVYNTRNIHPLLPYDPRSIAHMVDFFTAVFDLHPAIPSTDQRWYFKEGFTLIALIGAFLFLVPFTAFLLQIPLFRSLAVPQPPPLPAPRGKGRVIFWTTFAFSALVACLSFVPLVRATSFLFPATTGGQQTWWFPQKMNNAVLLWAVLNGSVALFLFWVTYRLYGRKNGVTAEMLGIRTTARELLKTVCLAMGVFAGFYLLLFAMYGVFHTDFRILFISAAASFPAKMLIVFLEYVPCFLIFYLANSIRVNSASRFEGQREWAGMLLMGIGNSVGLMLIMAIQYGYLFTTGTVFWTDEWLYVNLLFGVIPMMFVLPYFNRYFFRITGRVYCGAIVTCLVFILMMLTNNVCYIPLG
jgi:dienelactone hydrolase